MAQMRALRIAQLGPGRIVSGCVRAGMFRRGRTHARVRVIPAASIHGPGTQEQSLVGFHYEGGTIGKRRAIFFRALSG